MFLLFVKIITLKKKKKRQLGHNYVHLLDGVVNFVRLSNQKEIKKNAMSR